MSTPLRTCVLITSTLCALHLAAGCALTAAEEVTEQAVAVKPGTSVQVDTRNGRIQVSEGRAGKVSLRAVKRARSTSNPRKLLSRIQVSVKQKDGTLYVKAEHPDGSFLKQFGVDFELKVPKSTRLVLQTRNGSIRLARIHGPVAATTRNGSIRADYVGGALTALTRNGSIRIGGVGSTFEARTKNGSIRLRLADQVKLTAASTAETRNGSITLSAPPTLGANLQAETRNGRIRSDFGLTVLSRRNAAGKLGAGGPALKLQTRNGSITIEKR